MALVLLSIGVSAAFGLRYSIYGAIWRRIVKVAKLGPTEPEHEYPPRFAQVLGSIALVLSLLAFAVGATTLGWAFALAVAGLQTLLAVTGYCLGCRLYFLRWWVPDLVTRDLDPRPGPAPGLRRGADPLPVGEPRRASSAAGASARCHYRLTVCRSPRSTIWRTDASLVAPRSVRHALLV